MVNRRSTCAAALTAAILLSGAAGAEGVSIVEANVKDVAPGDHVPVARIPGGIYLRSTNDPDDTVWARIPEYRMRLAPAPPVHDSVMLRQSPDEAGKDVYFSVARTDDRFYVRLRWRDPSRDVVTAMDRFRDGAAVQFALKDDQTSHIMGTGPEAPVNIWYWRSDAGEIENLAAGGPGSTTRLPDQPVSGDSLYQAGDSAAAHQWVVVMSRPINSAGAHHVALDRPQVPIAFALWQGAEGQRDGHKIASEGWILLDTGVE